MSGTKSHSLTEQVTEPDPAQALIVAHGAPSDPAPQEATLATLAGQVGALLPHWHVRSATLAAPGAFEHALKTMNAPLIYPFFMADGWFAGTHLPARLASAGPSGAQIYAPFGSDPALVELAMDAAVGGATEAGFEPLETALVIAAHGGKRSAASGHATQALVQALSERAIFHSVRAGFVEQAPFLGAIAGEAHKASGPVAKYSVCLPIFALTAGHVSQDVPQALSGSGYQGLLLPPIGEHPRVPALIAAALKNRNTSEAA